jgi:hypothetical protein
MNMENIEKQIQELAAEYYRLIGPEHHKDRDCHWYIETVWSYGAPARYIVRHYGYLHDEVEETCATYQDALETLRSEIGHAIEAEKISQEQGDGVTFPSDLPGELRAGFEL